MPTYENTYEKCMIDFAGAICEACYVPDEMQDGANEFECPYYDGTDDECDHFDCAETCRLCDPGCKYYKEESSNDE